MSRRRRKKKRPPRESPVEEAVAEPAQAPAAEDGRPDLFLLLALVTVALGLRLYHLDRRDLWLDEAVSYFFARAALSELPGLLRFDSGPPLYYALLHVWTRLAGTSEIALRSLSTLAGVLLVPGLYLTGRRFLSRGVALTAAFFAAVTPIQVYYGQEARNYALLSLASLVVAFFLWRWLAERRRSDLAAYAVSLAAAAYVHNYAVFLVPVHGLVALLVRPARKDLLDMGLAWGASAVAYLPWIPIFREQFLNKGPYDWMALVWEAHGFLGSLWASVGSLAPGGPQPRYVDLEPWSRGTAVPVLLVAVLLVLGFYRLFQERHERPVPAWGLLASVLGTPLLVAAASWIRDPIYLPGRLEQLIVPFTCLVMACGVEALGHRLVRFGVLGAFAVLAVLTLRPYYAAQDPEGDRVLAAALEERLRPGDVIVTTSVTRAPLEYNLRHLSEIRWASFPAEVARHPGNVDVDALLEDRPGLEEEAAGLLSGFEAQPGWSGRVILIATPDAVTALLVDALTARSRSRPDDVVGAYKLSRVESPMQVFLLDYSAGFQRLP